MSNVCLRHFFRAVAPPLFFLKKRSTPDVTAMSISDLVAAVESVELDSDDTT